MIILLLYYIYLIEIRLNIGLYWKSYSFLLEKLNGWKSLYLNMI